MPKDRPRGKRWGHGFLVTIACRCRRASPLGRLPRAELRHWGTGRATDATGLAAVRPTAVLLFGAYR